MTKQALRTTFLAERKKLLPTYVQAMSEAVVAQMLSTFDFSQISLVHTFLPIRKQNEVNTFLLIEKLTHQYPNLPIFVPKANAHTQIMEHFRWHKDIVLQENQWGIPEPISDFDEMNRYAANAQSSIIIIPLLAYDVHGHRVGYGKGFYDRFLAQCPPQTNRVGVSFFEPVTQIMDTNSHDIRLNYCITPNNIWKF